MVLGSTTVNASVISEDDFPYQIWDSNENKLYISKTTFISSQQSRVSSGAYLIINGSKVWLSTDNYPHYAIGSRSKSTYILVYVDDIGWSAYSANYFSANSNYLVKWNTTSDVFDDLYSNQTISVGSAGSSVTLAGPMPEDLPEPENLQDILNATTNTTNEAQSLQADLASSYSSYQSGDITGDTLQSDIDTTVSTLNNLSDNSGNTLADLMAVNNGLTYAQTVQDKLNADELNEHLEITTAVKNAITGYINQSNIAYTDYTNGNKTQSETITTLQNQVIYLNQIITNGTAKNSADIEAVNTAINTVQGIINNVSNYSDLDNNLSETLQNADQEEVEFLNDMISEMQSHEVEKPFEDQENIEAGQNVTSNFLEPLFANLYFAALIPVSCGLILICIILDCRFRML